VKGLDALIRLRKWQLDEKRRQVAGLEQLADRLRRERQQLIDEFEAEKGTAARAPEAALTFGAYAEAVAVRRQKLETSLAQVLARLKEARDELTHAFQEVKQYEIAQANRQRRANEIRRRAEREAFDEIGINQYRRRPSA
jgi:flagellar export protein FliJ